MLYMLIPALVMWALIFWVAGAFGQAPPARYRGDATVTVQFRSPEAARSLCAIITGGRLSNNDACAADNFVIAPDPCAYGGRYAEIMCHEVGHVLGWRHD